MTTEENQEIFGISMPLGICSSYKEWSTSICTDTESSARCIAFEETQVEMIQILIYQVVWPCIQINCLKMVKEIHHIIQGDYCWGIEWKM